MKKLIILFIFSINTAIAANVFESFSTSTEALAACETLRGDLAAADPSFDEICEHFPDLLPLVSGFYQFYVYGNTYRFSYSTFVDPVTCTSGETKSLSVPFDDEVATVCIGGSNCAQNVEFEGCEYTVTYSGDCFTSLEEDNKVYCNYDGVASGNPSNGSLTPSLAGVPQDVKDPCIDINGLDLCTKTPQEQHCVEVNGQDVCIVAEPNCGSITFDGTKTKVCANDPKNCGNANGQIICQQEGVPTVNTACFTNPTGINCVSGKSGVKTQTETTVTTNPNNSTTTVSTTTNNVLKSVPLVETTTTSADGTTTSKTSTGGQGIKEGEGGEGEEGTNKYQGTSDCTKTPFCDGDPILCAVALNTHKQNCLFDPATNTVSAQGVKDALGYITNEDTSEEFSLATLDTSGTGISGSCPAPRTTQVLSASFTIDLSPFCEIADIVGVLILITASFVSLRIFGT